MDGISPAYAEHFMDTKTRFENAIMWPWRDLGIHAFKKILPYDQFTYTPLKIYSPSFVTYSIGQEIYFPNANAEQTSCTAFPIGHHKDLTLKVELFRKEYRIEAYVEDRSRGLCVLLFFRTYF